MRTAQIAPKPMHAFEPEADITVHELAQMLTLLELQIDDTRLEALPERVSRHFRKHAATPAGE